MRIAHLTTVHLSNDTRIFYKECRTLARTGHEVVLICPHSRGEVVDMVEIIPLPKHQRRFQRALFGAWKAYRTARKAKADAYHFHDPELIPLGVLLKLHGKKVVYDVHENLPRQIMTKEWIPRLIRPLVAALSQVIEQVGAFVFDAIVAATPTIGDRFPDSKTVVIQNFPMEEEFQCTKIQPYHLRPAIITYIGALSTIRGVKEFVRAMESLPPTVNLVVAGRFQPPSLEAEIVTMSGWGRTSYRGWLARNDISKLLAESRVGLVTLHPAPNYLDSYPVKMFEYMASGVPVVASDFPLWRSIVEEASCGILVNPHDPQSIADAVLWLLEHPREAAEMGRSGLEAVQSRFNWEEEGRKLVQLYEALGGESHGAKPRHHL